MFCSSCGTAVQGTLSYCNRCGAKVEGAGKPAEPTPNSLLNAVVVVFMAGLAAIVVLMALMQNDDGLNPFILVSTMLAFLMMIVVESVLIWMLLSSRRRGKERRDPDPSKERTTRELEEAQARLLAEPLPSVTEHTTRTFDPIYVERKSK